MQLHQVIKWLRQLTKIYKKILSTLKENFVIGQNNFVEFTKCFIDLTKSLVKLLINTWYASNLTKMSGWINKYFGLINKILLRKKIFVESMK